LNHHVRSQVGGRYLLNRVVGIILTLPFVLTDTTEMGLLKYATSIANSWDAVTPKKTSDSDLAFI